jgi:hypothetical protein
MLDLSLRYEYNGTAHDDLLLRFAGETWTCDSYYFALDRNLQEDDESAAKVRAVLRSLLEQWLSAIVNLPDSVTAFLPYDFSDQYTAWICCEQKGNDVEVSRGWALLKGWSIFPSAIGDYLFHLPTSRSKGRS